MLPYPHPGSRHLRWQPLPFGKALFEVFPLFPLFPVFFDSAEGRFEWKNLFVKVLIFD